MGSWVIRSLNKDVIFPAYSRHVFAFAAFFYPAGNLTNKYNHFLICPRLYLTTCETFHSFSTWACIQICAFCVCVYINITHLNLYLSGVYLFNFFSMLSTSYVFVLSCNWRLDMSILYQLTASKPHSSCFSALTDCRQWRPLACNL